MYGEFLCLSHTYQLSDSNFYKNLRENAEVVAGYILRLEEDRIADLEDFQTIDNRFSQPVPEFKYSRNLPLVCFLNNSGGRLMYLAMGRRGTRAGTNLSKLNLSQVTPVSGKYFLNSYIKNVAKIFQKPLHQKNQIGGLLTQKQFRALLDTILREESELTGFLRRYSPEGLDRIKALPRTVSDQLALQKEAVATAFGIAQIDRLPLQDWALESDEMPISFLDGLGTSRLREDQMIFNDLRKVPGFQGLRSDVNGSCVFTSNTGTTLTLILANRLPLEELTGADLIYYNETYKSFVLVQYKAMESQRAGSGPIYRLPNKQLDLELSRMEEICVQLDHHSSVVDKNDFRLSYDPFYLKLCSRIVFKPSDISLVPGMYIPLSQWKHLVKDQGIVGPKRGKGITYDNVGRYLDNTRFISLMSMAWIGTTSSASSILCEVIRETISSGRAAVIAVEENSRARTKR